jgi:hypothetical protein
MGLNLLEELEEGRGLARARRAEAEGIDGTAPLQCRTYAEFEAIHLSFTVLEVLGQVI